MTEETGETGSSSAAPGSRSHRGRHVRGRNPTLLRGLLHGRFQNGPCQSHGGLRCRQMAIFLYA